MDLSSGTGIRRFLSKIYSRFEVSICGATGLLLINLGPVTAHNLARRHHLWSRWPDFNYLASQPIVVDEIEHDVRDRIRLKKILRLYGLQFRLIAGIKHPRHHRRVCDPWANTIDADTILLPVHQRVS